MRILLHFLSAPFVLAAVRLVEKYIFSDWDFIGYLMVVIIIDTISGVWAAWHSGWVISFRLRSMLPKLGFYGIGLVIVHILTAHQVDGAVNPVFELVFPYFKGLVYVIILGSEVLSVDENLHKIFNRGFLPVWFRTRLSNLKEKDPIKANIIPTPKETMP